MNRQVARLNRIGVILGLLLGCIPTPSLAAEPMGTPDRLILWSSSSFSTSKLSVELGHSGTVKFRSCPEPIESSEKVCQRGQRALSKGELEAVSRLAREAKLFSGNTRGWQVDLAFRSLEVHSRDQVEILVTTLNDSFSKAGPRQELLDWLMTLENQMGRAK